MNKWTGCLEFFGTKKENTDVLKNTYIFELTNIFLYYSIQKY